MRGLARHGSCLVACLAILLIGIASVASGQSTVRVNGVLSPDVVSLPVGSAVFVGISGGPANPADWLGLGEGTDAALVGWSYLNGSAQPPASGVSDATIPWLLPAQPGAYHFRLYADNGWTCLAVGPLIAAQPSPATLAVNDVLPPTPLSVSGGTRLRVLVTQAPGNANDWVALYPRGAADGSYLAWQYLNGSSSQPPTGLTSATLTFQAPGTPGDYEFRLLTQASGRLATSTVVTATPSAAQLLVNGVGAPDRPTLSPGVTAAISVSGGPANPSDWVALYRSGASNGEYLAWKYLDSSTAVPAQGLTSAELSFLIPSEPGEYEFRFFANNGWDRLATSPTVVVATQTARLAVNAVVPPAALPVSAGTTVTVTFSGGPVNPTDWIALHRVGSSDTDLLSWRYLNGSTSAPAVGLEAGQLSFVLPTEAGEYEFRYFAAGGFQRLCTRAAVLVGVSAAQLTVTGGPAPGALTAVAGSVATVTIAEAPGNLTDWVALARVGSSDAEFVAWQYLSGSSTPPQTPLTAATTRFLLPTLAGTYEFRLFAANGYGRLATSVAISVGASPAQLSVNGLGAPADVTAAPATPLVVSVAAGPGNATDWLGLFPVGASDSEFVAWPIPQWHDDPATDRSGERHAVLPGASDGGHLRVPSLRREHDISPDGERCRACLGRDRAGSR